MPFVLDEDLEAITTITDHCCVSVLESLDLSTLPLLRDTFKSPRHQHFKTLDGLALLWCDVQHNWINKSILGDCPRLFRFMCSTLDAEDVSLPLALWTSDNNSNSRKYYGPS
jgi:hypothetical protein